MLCLAYTTLPSIQHYKKSSNKPFSERYKYKPLRPKSSVHPHVDGNLRSMANFPLTEILLYSIDTLYGMHDHLQFSPPAFIENIVS